MTDGVREFLSRDLRAAAIPWALARVFVVGSLALSRFGVDHLHVRDRPVQLRQGLFAWDAAFYREIAEHGYRTRGALRFYPLVPILARGLGTVLFGHTAAALLIVANGSALVFGALLYRFAWQETRDARLARRAAWFAAIFPTAMALVLGYAEATVMALAVGVFLAARSRRFAWAIPLGLLAGLGRPLGVLLVLPLAVEAARGWPAASLRDRLVRGGAVASPLAGTAVYFAWVGAKHHDAFLPLRLQSSRRLRGGFVDPFTRVFDGVSDLIHGDRFGSGLHIVWAAIFIALIVVLIRRFPPSAAVFAGATVLVNLTASNLDSFERYAFGAFPLVLAIATITDRVEIERTVLAGAAGGLVGYSILAFLGVYVP